MLRQSLKSSRLVCLLCIAVFVGWLDSSELSAQEATKDANVAAQQILAPDSGKAKKASTSEGNSQGKSGEAEKSIKPGINENFLNPALDVSEWLGRFEIESREVYAARETVLKACAIKEGFRIADIGTGTGFYSRLFADKVGPKGWVYAVDISPKFLDHVNQKSSESGIDNLTSILCTDRSVRLPPNSVDMAFVCDTYHHFEYPQSTLASIYRAVKPGGTFVVIDFDRIPGKSREFILGHVRAGKEVFQAEVIEAGFRFVEEIKVPGFKENYLLRFRKD